MSRGFYVPLLLSFLVIACTKQINFPEIDFENNISCNAFICPDSNINVYFTSNSELYRNPDLLTKEISAFIIVNNSKKFELINKNHLFYSTYKPNIGDSIQIEMKSSSKFFHSETYIPEAVGNILVIQVDTFFNSTNGIQTPIINVQFQNKKQDIELNYFEICMNVSTNVDSNGNWLSYYLPYTTAIGKNRKKINEMNEYSIYNLLFSDSLFNTEKIEFELIVFSIANDNKLLVDSVKAQVVVRSVSKDYFYYKKSFLKQRATKTADIFSGPSVPVQLYSNIKNGNGIFAGYSTSTAEIVVQHKK